MPEIELNGVKYKAEVKDGKRMIDGKPVSEFLKELESKEDWRALSKLATLGMSGFTDSLIFGSPKETLKSIQSQNKN